MLVGLYDTETNGLLHPQGTKTVATKMHCIGLCVIDTELKTETWYSGCDGPYWSEQGIKDVRLPSGEVLKAVRHVSIAEVLRVLEGCDIRVAHNGQGFDDRICRKFYPWWDPKGEMLDTLHVSRLLYPSIFRQGPNGHRVPGKLKTAHSIKAWGYRLGSPKDDFDAGDWQTWTPGMQTYMLQDIASMRVTYKFLMYQKPAPMALKIEHQFAAIIRRQEVWGFTVDYPKLLALQATLEAWKAGLETKLIEHFGSWWKPGKEKRVTTTRRVKLPDYPDVTRPRYGTSGKRLPKDYVGPPTCLYEAGAVFTPVEYLEFSPSSRDHVATMLKKKYGWRPHKFTEGGAPAVDDEVLQALPYPEAPLLAAYYAILKVSGYVASGKNAWLLLAQEEVDGWRMHGDVITIGTYTFRCSHMRPNMGQIPTRHPFWGHQCRELFMARRGFKLVGFDGSGMQLRLLAHYMAEFDGGAYAKIVAEEDPHSYMRDLCCAALETENYTLTWEDIADAGRGKGKTTNYALTFGGGDVKLGSIWRPYEPEAKQRALGKAIREMMSVRLVGLAEVNTKLRVLADQDHYLVGLDGRRAPVPKSFAALSTMLQMGEGVVMKLALCLLDRNLQAEGLRCGVTPSGIAKPEEADYEFTVNVHDEAQADVRDDPRVLEIYERLALQCVRDAGRKLRVQCPLKSDVKIGQSWAETH